MRTLFSSPSPSPPHSSQSSPSRHTFSVSMIEENLETADSIIRKWEVEEASSNYCKFDLLFHGDRREAMDFLRSVKDVQSAMQFFVSENKNSELIVHAQNLMQVAMKRLQKEFYHILSSSRNHLDKESVSTISSRVSARSSISDREDDDLDEYEEDDEVTETSSTSENISELAMSDMKSIADIMISSGYGKECVKIYRVIRKSIVDESLYYLRIENLSLSQIQKMEWESLEKKIRSWSKGVKVAVKSVFDGERILCEHVFSSSARIAESCFLEIASESALNVFAFPEMVVSAKSKKLSPEKMFRILDLYDAISELWPEIESIFSYESTASVRSQAVTSLVKLGEVVRSMLSEFELQIQKDASKAMVPGGGVHPLTRYVLNYLVFLSDYSGILCDIVADWPLPNQAPLPETYFSSPTSDDSPTSAISVRLAWMILVVLCKLDGKAGLYKEVSLSYLFLANNLNYVVSKVRSSNLKLLLGEDWLNKHEVKANQYASNYERIGWSRVLSSLPAPGLGLSPEKLRESVEDFNSAFQETHRKHSSWAVPDPKFRGEIKVSLARKLVPAYREFHDNYRGMLVNVRYAPEDLENYLSDLFHGATESFGGSTSSSSLSSLLSHST